MKHLDTDGIIFDVDGTLWDTTPVVETAWNDAMDECGLSYAHVTAHQLKGLFGLPMEVIIDRILPKENDEVKSRFQPLCYNNEHDYLLRTPGKLYDKVGETLSELSKKHKLFIVSNCQEGYIELFLEKTGFGPYISDHLCPGDTGKHKAENIQLICQRNNLKNAFYVGDTHMDQEACEKAGVPFIFASYGFGKTKKTPDETIRSFSDLLEIF
ncbi:MAG: HAD family hydrolase [Treponema sp.]|nr:HAD family hydrolase [Treponema sp.]